MFEKDDDYRKARKESKDRITKVIKAWCAREEVIHDKGFEQGAEFGYNKANEWHFVKDGDLPKKDGMYLFYLYDKEDTLDYFCEVLDISDTDKDPYLETSLLDVEDVIAWKEIVLPELPKEVE